MKHLNVAIVAASILVAAPVMAQPQRGGGGGQFERMRGGPQMTDEQLESAWTHEATTVATRLELNKDMTAEVIEAYVGVRKDYNEAMAKAREAMMEEFRRMREEGGGGFGGGERGGDRDADRPRRGGGGGGGDDADRPRRERPDGGGGFGRGGGGFGAGGGFGGPMGEAMMEAREDHQLRLDLELTSIIGDDDKVEHAMKSLGTFNGSWDRMVHTLIGFELDDEAMNTALAATEKFVIETSFDRSQMGPDTDFEAMREKMNTARETLNESMKTVLTEDQFTEFERTTNRRRGRRMRDDV